MRNRILLPVVAALALVLCALAPPLHARTIHVPADSVTIQGAIAAASDGDTVLVAPGTVHEHGVDFLGKAIRVTGSDPGDSAVVAATVVDGDSAGSVFLFRSGEGRASILTGLTITGGRADDGGGIHCEEADPTIARCILTGNSTTAVGPWRGGGAIYCDRADPLIADNLITGNGTANSGAGIACDRSHPTIRDNVIVENVAGVEGGGIYVHEGWPTILDNVISRNDGGEYGGGIAAYSAGLTVIDGNTIEENAADQRGGGVFSENGILTITGNRIVRNRGAGIYGPADIIGNLIADNEGSGIHFEWASDRLVSGNRITGNVAPYDGGGIFCYESRPIITDNEIIGNRAGASGGGISVGANFGGNHPEITRNVIAGNTAVDGGGIWYMSPSPTMNHNTIADNTASRGGGIFCLSFMEPNHAILWNNHAPEGPQIWVGGDPHSADLRIRFSDVAGGEDSVHVEPGGRLVWEVGMIDADPRFVLPDAGDCRLLWHVPGGTGHSPCIDAGDPASPDDPDGTRSDIGARPFDQDDPLTLYLSPHARDVAPGETLPITWTLINRWPAPEPFGLISEVVLPGGEVLGVIGPTEAVLPTNRTVTRESLLPVPPGAPAGAYEYRGWIGPSRSERYDDDRFGFIVGE